MRITRSSVGPGSPPDLLTVEIHSNPSGPADAPLSRPYRSSTARTGAAVTAPLPGSVLTIATASASVSATAIPSGAAAHPATPGRSGHVHAGPEPTTPSAPTRCS